ncbi:MAG: sensor histidine kinase [Acidimicrobiales bacterium]
MSDDEDANLGQAQHEELWEAVLRTAVDPIIVIEDDGTILRANAATDRLFGYSGAYLVGKNVNMLMAEPYRSEHDGYLQRYRETGERRIIGIGREVEAQKAGGEVFPIALAVSEIRLGDRSWFTGIIHDLTHRRQAEDELVRAKEELEERVVQRTAELEASMAELARSNRDLEQFAYIASHDLQTPLRNVRQGLQLFDEHLRETLGQSLDSEAEELRDLTVAAALKMEQLVQGLLAYSRLDRSGRPSSDPVDLNQLAGDLVRQMKATDSDIAIDVASSPLPTVLGDETQLRQLLQNLLENAVKYRSTDRPLKVTVTAEPEDDRWVVSVGDNGIGIDPEQHRRVFELFRRAHPEYEGMGLGLAICQRIIERHGGEIWVTTGPEGGSVFSFTLPRTDLADGVDSDD